LEKGGFEKKKFFFIKSPLTPLFQRGETREGVLPKRGNKGEALPKKRGNKGRVLPKRGNNGEGIVF